MFDRDRWAEIIYSLRHHRLRTLLTAFGVFWGIFLLVVLLGMGKGLEHGLMNTFRYWAANSAWMAGQKTSLAYAGFNPGREIKLSIDDVEMLARLPGVEAATPERQLPGEFLVRYGRRTSSFEVVGIYPAFARLAKTTLVKGRQINPLDLSEGRKVAVISTRVTEMLFPAERNPVGETILINSVPFRVVGVHTHAIAPKEERRVFIPYTTLRTRFNPSREINYIGLGFLPGYTWERLRLTAMRYLGTHHRFDPADAGAIFIEDYNAQYQQIQILLMGIRLFLAVVGTGTLLAGCIGVSNIMLIAVKERTREIGIRKAIGAKPGAILMMILQEALIIITLSGCAGLAAGIGLVELVRRSGMEAEFFRDPQIDPTVALGALGILLLAGLVAGYLPARQAVKIQPVEALRYE